MRQSKPTIGNLMVLVAFVAITLAFARSGHLSSPLGLFAWMFSSPWLLVPLHMRKTQTIPLEISRIPIDPHRTSSPPEFSDAYLRAADDLASLEFIPVGCFCYPTVIYNGLGYLAVFRNPQTGELAKFITSIAGAPGPIRISRTLMFQSEFDGGIEVVTSDSDALNTLPPLGRGVHGLALTDIGGVGSLLRAHRARADRIAGDFERLDPLVEGLEAHFEKGDRRLRGHQLKCGYYHVDRVHSVLRLTWKGAFLSTWKLMWPVKPIRMAYRQHLARKTLRNLGSSRSAGGR